MGRFIRRARRPKTFLEHSGVSCWNCGANSTLGKVPNATILKVRAELARRLREKAKIRECILTDIERMGEDTPLPKLEHVSYMPSWQKKIRSMENNLGLRL